LRTRAALSLRADSASGSTSRAPMTGLKQTADSAGRPLDALNFFLADVRDGLGPYLAIYLLTVQKWDEASIGLVMAVAGIAGILAQTPAGAIVDSATAKRGLVIAAAAVVTIASLAVPLVTNAYALAGVQSLSAVAAAVFPPAIAAITLGIVGPKAFARRMGRNEGFNHAGNAVAAGLAAALAYLFGPVVVFWLMAAMAIASTLATLAIPANAIDNDVARGLARPDRERSAASQAGAGPPPSAWRTLLANPTLLIFAAAMVLFHFSNAAMLPLAGQKLALQNPALATSLMAACIVAAQLIMVPVALVVGAKADIWGRKPIFLAAFLVLAVRGALYPLSDSPYWIVGVQLLDGIGAGIFGALFPVVVADLTRGKGHFNLSLGAIATASGIGAALSTAFAGLLVVRFGYGVAFQALAAVAVLGLILYAFGMPETRSGEAPAPSEGDDESLTGAIRA
jgi:MFS family permease